MKKKPKSKKKHKHGSPKPDDEATGAGDGARDDEATGAGSLWTGMEIFCVEEGRGGIYAKMGEFILKKNLSVTP